MSQPVTVVLVKPYNFTATSKDRNLHFGQKKFTYSQPTYLLKAFRDRKLVSSFFSLHPTEEAPLVEKDSKKIEAHALLFLKNEGEEEELRLTSIFSTLPSCKS